MPPRFWAPETASQHALCKFEVAQSKLGIATQGLWEEYAGRALN